MANFNGQTAVITGGAQGIGLATAKRFINDGCEVIIWDIDKKMGMDAAKELNCHFLEVDQTDNQIVEQATVKTCLLYTSPSPRDRTRSRMPSSA